MVHWYREYTISMATLYVQWQQSLKEQHLHSVQGFENENDSCELH